MIRRWLSLLCVPLLACSGTKPPVCTEALPCPPTQSCRDGACVELPGDAGEDAGEPDAGPDAGADAGPDAGEPDAGLDGGEPDGGPDAGPIDAGCAATFDAGNPPNLLPNAAFECGEPPIDWVPSPSGSLVSETANPRSGLRAARLISDDGGVPVSLFPLVPLPSSGQHTYCGTAWLRGEPAGGTARISIWVLTPSGGLAQSNFSAPLTAEFSQLTATALSSQLDDRVTMRLWMVSPAKGDVMVVDDAELWVSADGGCADR